MSYEETERTIWTYEIKRTAYRSVFDQAGAGHGTAKGYFNPLAY
jgi:hypothetical protein